MIQNHSIEAESIISHFATRAEKYEEHLDWVNDERILGLMIDDLIEREECPKILDLGAGTGAVAKYILKKNAGSDLVAVDICENMLDKISDSRIKKICTDVRKLPFEDMSFDFIVSRQCLHYVEDLDQVLSEVSRVLKPGGIFVLAQIVPCNQETATDWEDVTRVRQPLRLWFYTSEEWDLAMKRHSLVLKKSKKYVKRASINKWSGKYTNSSEKIQEYRKKILSMNETYKETYAVQETEEDVIYHSFWHIAQYCKEP